MQAATPEEQRGAGKKAAAAPSANRSSWADDDWEAGPRRARVDSQSVLAWDFALAALLGEDSREFDGIRPVVVQDSTTRQVFLERPRVRRAPGGDKWRFSGGQRGGQYHTYRNDLGVRKRYGMVIRGGDATGREPIKFMCFSLLTRASPDAMWAEKRDAALYVVAEVTDTPPNSVASGAGTVAEGPATTPVDSGWWFGGWGMRPATVATIDVRAGAGFFADVLRSISWRQPEESVPHSLTPELSNARQQRQKRLEPANSINAARPWPVSGESDAPDPELDTVWDPRQTGDSDMDAVQFDPFADEFDAFDPGQYADWDFSEFYGAGDSPHVDEDAYDWNTDMPKSAEPPQPDGGANLERVWARKALESEAANDPTVDRAEVEELVDPVVELMHNLSISVEATPTGQVHLTPDAGPGRELTLPISNGRSPLPTDDLVRECLDLHEELFQDPTAERREVVRAEWADACLRARSGNVGLAAELLGKYMKWRDKYDIASEGQPSSPCMQVCPGHASTGMQPVFLPRQYRSLVVCSVKQSDRLGWFVQVIMRSGVWYCI